MTILQADLKMFNAVTVNDTTSNGGLMDDTSEVKTGVKNNVWPNVSIAERAAGLTRYRKLFAVPQSDNDDQLIDPFLWNHKATAGDDYIVLFTGTKSDTQATLVETRKFGTAPLKNDASIGVTALTVTVEDVSLTGIFQANDKIRVSNTTLPASGDLIIELNATTPGISGSDVTVYFDTATVTEFLASNTQVSSLYYPGTSETSNTSPVVTSSSGSVDDTTYPIILNNSGTRDEEITVTFSDATNFSVAGNRSGSFGSGTVSTDFEGLNPDNSKVAVSFTNGFFGGTFATSDTVVFSTVSNSIPFWEKQVVPVASSSLSGNNNITCFMGEGA